MGLSASQARLLTLTARLSDLELNAQQISNSKIRLAMESSQISEDYANALDKKELSILKGYDSKGDKEYEDLDYYNLTGPNSPLLTQYCLTNNNGNVLVTQEEASAFEQSGGDLDAFLVNCGAVKHTTTYPSNMTKAQYLQALQDAQNAINSTYSTYQTDIGNTEQARKALDAYGASHVKGYSGSGQWSYKNATGIAFTTSYSDSSVFNKLASSGRTFTDQWEMSGVSPYHGYSSSSSGSVVDFYQGSNLSTAASMLSGIVSTVTSDTASAVLSVLKGQYSDSAYSAIESKLGSAVSTATQKTQSFFSQQLANHQTYPEDDEYNTVTIANTRGTNQIWDDSQGLEEFYVDVNQVAATFLAYFDAACAQLNGQSGASYTNEVGSPSTYRTGAGGTGSASAYTTTYTTCNSSSTPNQIQYITGSGETTDSVAATYQALLSTYTGAASSEAAAKTAWESAKTHLADLQGGVTTATLTTSEKGYYTNIFNKMSDSGYIYMENEEDTLNNSAWIQSQITSGNLLLEKCAKDEDTNDTNWSKVTWSSCSDIEEDSDDAYVTKQEAKYQAEMSKIEAKDKKFDLQLKNIDTEHNAVQTEIESVQKVIDKNIERSFKIFQNA